MKKLSLVIPIFNEEENLPLLHKEIRSFGQKFNGDLEIIFVNDGSTDKTGYMLERLGQNDKRIKTVSFTRNFGQTAAFDAGIKNSSGEIIVTLDGDLQNDPMDIFGMIAKLEMGFDVVCGWRKVRRDSPQKRVFSFLANRLRTFMTGESIHDSGCSLRVYKRQVFEGLDLYGETHRFIPSILSLKGYRITEMSVSHRKRYFGVSKYNYTRILKGIFDLLFITFMMRFSTRPIHVFGMMGMITFGLGLMLGFYLSFIKLAYGATLSNRPLLILSVLLIILGTQFFIFGILAEILIRIYYKTHRLLPYTLKKNL